MAVKVGYAGGTLWARAAGERRSVHDHVERRWRHLAPCGFETLLGCRVPRVRTPAGQVETVLVPWAGQRRRFTLLYERWALEVLLACRSVRAAAEWLGLSWEQRQAIMERAVERGLERGLERRDLAGLRHVGMAEQSFAKGPSDVSLRNDLDGGRVRAVEQGHARAAADRLLAALPAEVRAAIAAGCIDRSGHLAAAARAGWPGAALVPERCHSRAHLNDGVAAVPREENRRWQKLGDERLKGTPRLFGFDPDRFDQAPAVRFAELQGRAWKSARAWAIKEGFRRFWSYSYAGSARKFFQEWSGWASRRRLQPMLKVAKMWPRHFANISTYRRQPITNAVRAGLHSKIQAIKANARGFRSDLNYRTRILCFCGKLDLYPL